MIAPAIDQIAAERACTVKVGKVNVGEQPELADRAGVQGIPFVGLYKSGQPAGRVVGARPKAALEHALGRSRTAQRVRGPVIPGPEPSRCKDQGPRRLLARRQSRTRATALTRGFTTGCARGPKRIRSHQTCPCLPGGTPVNAGAASPLRGQRGARGPRSAAMPKPTGEQRIPRPAGALGDHGRVAHWSTAGLVQTVMLSDEAAVGRFSIGARTVRAGLG